MSDFWFTEREAAGFENRFLIEEEIFQGKSDYQEIRVLASRPYGRMLILDGIVQTTESDEFVYHEMLVHVPLMLHTAPRAVLIVGGGDGGTLRRVLEHPSVERAVMVEIDRDVVDVSRRYLPSIAGEAWDDPRAELIFGDGAAYAMNAADGSFDAVLIDSTDVIVGQEEGSPGVGGPALSLFTPEFFGHCARILSADGVLAAQSGGPLYQPAELALWSGHIGSAFPTVATYLCSVPTYPGVVWSFTLGTKTADPFSPDVEEVVGRLKAMPHQSYYNALIQVSAFVLPNYVEEIIRKGLGMGTAS